MARALRLAHTVWKAMVLYEVEGDRHFLDLLSAAVEQLPPGPSLVNALIERQQTWFGNDHRLSGTYQVLMKHGERTRRADMRAISS